MQHKNGSAYTGVKFKVHTLQIRNHKFKRWINPSFVVLSALIVFLSIWNSLTFPIYSLMQLVSDGIAERS